MKGVLLFYHHIHEYIGKSPIIAKGECFWDKDRSNINVVSCPSIRRLLKPDSASGRWSELQVGDMKTGEELNPNWKGNLPDWFYNPLLRAIKLAQWKQAQKRKEKHEPWIR